MQQCLSARAAFATVSKVPACLPDSLPLSTGLTSVPLIAWIDNILVYIRLPVPVYPCCYRKASFPKPGDLSIKSDSHSRIRKAGVRPLPGHVQTLKEPPSRGRGLGGRQAEAAFGPCSFAVPTLGGRTVGSLWRS